jgi:hypothetical protein
MRLGIALVGLLAVTLRADAQALSPGAVDPRLWPSFAPQQADARTSLQLGRRVTCEDRRRTGQVIGAAIGATSLMVAVVSADSATRDPLVYLWAGSWGGLLGSGVGNLLSVPAGCPHHPPDDDGDPRRCVADIAHDAGVGALTGGMAGFLLAPVALFPVFIFGGNEKNSFDRVVLLGTATGVAYGTVYNVVRRQIKCRGER